MADSAVRAAASPAETPSAARMTPALAAPASTSPAGSSPSNLPRAPSNTAPQIRPPERCCSPPQFPPPPFCPAENSARRVMNGTCSEPCAITIKAAATTITAALCSSPTARNPAIITSVGARICQNFSPLRSECDPFSSMLKAVSTPIPAIRYPTHATLQPVASRSSDGEPQKYSRRSKSSSRTETVPAATPFHPLTPPSPRQPRV